MGAKLDGEAVAAQMRARGLEPLEPYPGALSRWRVRCMVCGSESAPKWSKVKARGDGCKECGKKRAADAKRIDPEVAADYVRKLGYEPLEPFTESKKPWRMVHVSCGREVTPKWDNLKAGQGGCPECGKWKAAESRRNDAGDAVEQMRSLQLDPLEPYPGRKHPWRCLCMRCGQETVTNMETVLAGNLGCIPCGRLQRGKKRRRPAEQAIATMGRVGLTPVEEFPGRNKPWRSTCNKCGEESTLSLSSALVRLSKSETDPAQGCDACVFEELSRARKLSQEEAEARMAAIGMTPVGPYLGITVPWHAICQTCGAENDVNLPHAFARGRGCNACSLKARSDFHRKPEEEAVAQMLAAGFRPLEPYVNSNTPWRAVHDVCGYEVTPRLSSLAKTRSCGVCGGKQVALGFNDLATTHPQLAREMAIDKGFDPTTFTAGSGKKALWRCDQGHEWKAVIGSRAAQGTGCPVCANKGFNITEPAWMYLMRHDGWDMLQVGITNDPTVRAATHARNGWEPVDMRGPMDGVLAQDWETSILRLLRSLGVEMTPSGVADQPSRTGSVRRKGEAWWRDDYDAATVRELMDAVEAAEAARAVRVGR